MKKIKKQSVSVFIPITNLTGTWKGDLQLPKNQTFDLIIDYPFGCERVHHFPIKTGKHGLELTSLLNKIGEAYEKIYEDPEGNGVFGHDIYDLSLEGIDVDFVKRTIKLEVGS